MQIIGNSNISILHLTASIGSTSGGVGPVALGFSKEQKLLGCNPIIWSLDSSSVAQEAVKTNGLNLQDIKCFKTLGPHQIGYSLSMEHKALTKGEGTVHPTANSNVKVHYHGTLIDGTVFDSSVDRGEPISFGLNQVIAGWTEGLQLMVEGDKFRFYIPSSLAYGNRSTGGIPAGSLLIFEVQLLAFE